MLAKVFVFVLIVHILQYSYMWQQWHTASVGIFYIYIENSSLTYPCDVVVTCYTFESQNMFDKYVNTNLQKKNLYNLMQYRLIVWYSYIIHVKRYFKFFYIKSTDKYSHISSASLSLINEYICDTCDMNILWKQFRVIIFAPS